MKFQCDRCKTRYSIADEKVRGKVLKIRCKNCASIITVREGAEAKHPEAETPRVPRPTPHGAAAKSAPVLARAFEKAMSAPVPEFGPDTEDDELGGEQTKVAETPIPLLVDEWYLSVDGSQDGPFTLSQAQQRVAEMPPGEEMYAWRDGFDDWLAVDRVPELATHVNKRPARRVGAPPAAGAVSRGRSGSMPALAAAPASPSATSSSATTGPTLSKTISGMGPDARAARVPSIADDKNTPIPLSELAAAASLGATPKPEGNGEQKRPGEFDFVVSEASQMVQLSTINGAASTGQAPIVTRTTAKNGLPGIGRGTGESLALPPSATPLSTGASPVLAPVVRKKKSHAAIIIAGSVAALAILGVILYVGTRHRSGADDGTGGDPAQGAAGGSEVIDKFYEGGGLPGTNPPSTMKPAAGSESGTADKGTTQRPRNGIRAPITTTQPRQPSGKQDLFTGEDDPTQVTVDDILDKGKIANPAMKQCFNRALKNDPTLRITRMDLRITVGTSGLVTEVRPLTHGGDSKVLTDCLVGIVKGWRFHKSNEGLTADLPIIFSNG